MSLKYASLLLFLGLPGCIIVNTDRERADPTPIHVQRVFNFYDRPHFQYAADKECRSIRADLNFVATYVRVEPRGAGYDKSGAKISMFYMDFTCESSDNLTQYTNVTEN